MYENVEGCNTIYSHKSLLDYNYSQMKRLKFIKRNTKRGNLACNNTNHILWVGTKYIIQIHFRSISDNIV